MLPPRLMGLRAHRLPTSYASSGRGGSQASRHPEWGIRQVGERPARVVEVSGRVDRPVSVCRGSERRDEARTVVKAPQAPPAGLPGAGAGVHPPTQAAVADAHRKALLHPVKRRGGGGARSVARVLLALLRLPFGSRPRRSYRRPVHPPSPSVAACGAHPWLALRAAAGGDGLFTRPSGASPRTGRELSCGALLRTERLRYRTSA